VEPKGNILFSGLKKLLQRMLFIALLFYLAVDDSIEVMGSVFGVMDLTSRK
jgi:hypothetical protein